MLQVLEHLVFVSWGGAAVSGHVGTCLDKFGSGIAGTPS